MFLRRFVRGAINAVNNNVQIGWLVSTGQTTNAATGVQTPTYAALQNPWAQIQPLSTDDLAHVNELNIQGVLRTVYMYGAVASAVRADGTGGDLLQFPEIPGGPMRTWLVMKVVEVWGGSDWCHVICRLQVDMHA